MKMERPAKLVTGYVCKFGEANLAGEVIEHDTVVRAPKWLATELEKDDFGVKVMVAVPVEDMPGFGENRLDLSAGEIEMLRNILAEQKTKVGETVKRMQEDTLLAKLDDYLNPQLFPTQRPASSSSKQDEETVAEEAESSQSGIDAGECVDEDEETAGNDDENAGL